MTVLVDTSVWVDHFRHPNADLAELMLLDRVLTHPFVVGELACGTPPAPRLRTLGDMALLLPDSGPSSIGQMGILATNNTVFPDAVAYRLLSVAVGLIQSAISWSK